MNELKPCPFCGGRAAVAQNASVFLDYRVYCKRCGAETGMYTTAIKAVRCWNTREERTCRAIPNREWVEKPECGVDCHTCSECGKVLFYDANEDCPRYCPNCGAKVVEE